MKLSRGEKIYVALLHVIMILAGLCLGGALYQVPILLDGMISADEFIRGVDGKLQMMMKEGM